MSAPHPLGAQNPAFEFSSSEGHTFCRRNLSKLLSFEPHDVQIEAISQLLDGIDLFALDITNRDGKNEVYINVNFSLLEIQRDPTLCSSAVARFSKNPCIPVVQPVFFPMSSATFQINVSSY